MPSVKQRTPDLMTLVHDELEITDSLLDSVDYQTLSMQEIMLKEFDTFLSNCDITFDISNEQVINEMVMERFLRIFYLRYYDHPVSYDTGFAFKLKFQRTFYENIDKFNRLIRLNVTQLDEIESKLYKIGYTTNINATENDDYAEMGTRAVDESSSNTKSTDTTESLDGQDKQNQTDTNKKNTSHDSSTTDSENVSTENQEDVSKDTSKEVSTNGSSDSDKDETSRDFTRQLYEDTPESRLNISSSDGSGVISGATNITENLINHEGESSEHVSNESTENTVADETISTTGSTSSDTDSSSLTREAGEVTENGTLNNTVDHTQDKTGSEEIDGSSAHESETDTTKDYTLDKLTTRVIENEQLVSSKATLLADYKRLFDNPITKFVNCFDSLFSHVFL